MSCRRAVFAVVLSLTLGLASIQAAGGRASITPGDLKEWLTFLASDELEGRAVFTEGLGIAAGYIQGYLQAWGVKPGGDHGGYLQTVRVRGVKVDQSLDHYGPRRRREPNLQGRRRHHLSAQCRRKTHADGRPRRVYRLRSGRPRPHRFARPRHRRRRGRVSRHERPEGRRPADVSTGAGRTQPPCHRSASSCGGHWSFERVDARATRRRVAASSGRRTSGPAGAPRARARLHDDAASRPADRARRHRQRRLFRIPVQQGARPLRRAEAEGERSGPAPVVSSRRRHVDLQHRRRLRDRADAAHAERHRDRRRQRPAAQIHLCRDRRSLRSCRLRGRGADRRRQPSVAARTRDAGDRRRSHLERRRR